MLQIISGKFFRTADRRIFQGYGILYSNVIILDEVRTTVASIHPVDWHGSVARYVVTYTNQLETGTGFIRTGDVQIVEQLGLLASFGFRGFFSASRSEVEHVCRAERAVAGGSVPSELIDRFCDPRIRAEANDVKRFVALVEATIGLRREAYLAVIEYLRNFVGALRALDENIHLAYSMLVYGLEALSQTFKDFRPEWSDVEDRVRTKMDSILSDHGELRTEVQTALLQSVPVAAQKRLEAFIKRSLPDEFFVGSELKGRNLPLRLSHLHHAIKSAYDLRSGYVHRLQRDGRLDPFFGKWDVVMRLNKPILTLRGLARLAETVARNFIATHEKVTFEEVDWRSGLPGIIYAELAPETWAWRGENFRREDAGRWLTGFLEHLDRLQWPLDVRNLLTVWEANILNRKVSAENKRAMAALYCLYHGIVRTTDSERNDDVERKSEELLQDACIESLLTRLILEQSWTWAIDDIEQAVKRYEDQKFHKLGVVLPACMEAALFAQVGNQRLSAGDVNAAIDWCRKAMLELAGEPEKQRYIKRCYESGVAVVPARLVKPWSVNVSTKF